MFLNLMVMWFKLSLNTGTLNLKMTVERKKILTRCIQHGLLQIHFPMRWALFSQGKTHIVTMNSINSSAQTSHLQKYICLRLQRDVSYKFKSVLQLTDRPNNCNGQKTESLLFPTNLFIFNTLIWVCFSIKRG